MSQSYLNLYLNDVVIIISIQTVHFWSYYIGMNNLDKGAQIVQLPPYFCKIVKDRGTNLKHQYNIPIFEIKVVVL